MRDKNKYGFTVAELLAVVGIVAILAAIAVVVVSNYLRDFSLNEYDSAAKSIYIATQNNMADLQASGEWTAREKSYNKKNAPLSEDPNDGFTYCYISAEEARTNGMLPVGTIEEEVRSQSFIIEYCYSTATVYGVFYTEASQAELANYYANTINLRARDTRRVNDPIIGYYGGAGASDLNHEKLLVPVVSAGRGPNLTISDPNLSDSKLKSANTSTIVTLVNETKKAAAAKASSAFTVTLVLKKGTAVTGPSVSFVDGDGKLVVVNNSPAFCGWGEEMQVNWHTYVLNLTQMKSNEQLSSLLASFEAGDEYSVTAKCVSSAVVCLPSYAYGEGVWPSNDEVVFTSNIIADYQSAADLYLYTSEANSQESEHFSFNLENYYNDDTLAGELLFYKVSCSDGIVFEGAEGIGGTQGTEGAPYVTSVTGNTEKLIEQRDDGTYCYSENIGEMGEGTSGTLSYHRLDNFYVPNVGEFTQGTITITAYRASNQTTLLGESLPNLGEVAKTLTINVFVMNSEKDWDFYVDDRGSYAEVVVTAGSSATPNIGISTSVAVADWTNASVASRTEDGSLVELKSLPAGGSISVRFLKPHPDIPLTTRSFTVTSRGGATG